MTKKFIKRFGKEQDKDNLFIRATTFDGCNQVLIITPKNPTKKQEQDTKDFILGELDDHDVYEEYLKNLRDNKPIIEIK